MKGFELTPLAQIRRDFFIFEQATHRFSEWILAMQCKFLTGILDFVYMRFAENDQRVHPSLCTEIPAASLMLDTFEEVGGDVLEYFSSVKKCSKNNAVKSYHEKNSSKNFTAGVFLVKNLCFLSLSKRCPGPGAVLDLISYLSY